MWTIWRWLGCVGPMHWVFPEGGLSLLYLLNDSYVLNTMQLTPCRQCLFWDWFLLWVSFMLSFWHIILIYFSFKCRWMWRSWWRWPVQFALVERGVWEGAKFSQFMRAYICVVCNSWENPCNSFREPLQFFLLTQINSLWFMWSNSLELL